MKKLLLPMLATLLVLGLAGAGTLAVFSDTESSTANTFTAGTLDLNIRALDNDESLTTDPSGEDDNSLGDFSSATWVISNITPGANAFCTRGATDCVGGDKVTGKVRLKLAPGSSITPDHVEVRASLTLDENPVESDTVSDSSSNEMARKLRLLTTSWNGNNCLTGGDDTPNDSCLLSDNDGDGVLTLNDLTFDNALDDLKPVPATNLEIAFLMVLQWAEDSAMPGLGYTANCGNDSGLCDNAFQGDELTMTVEFTLNQVASQ